MLSMNLLMAGMVPTVMALRARIPAARRSNDAKLLVRDVHGASGRLPLAYPMNWWLVAHHLKHGMMTVRRRVRLQRPVTAHRVGMDMTPQAAPAMRMDGGAKPWPPVPVMALLSFLALAAGS
jgi:hypothetical protein